MSATDNYMKTSATVQEKANLIWSIADKLVGLYKPVEYANVILPMCVIKRFEDTLAPTKQRVLDENKRIANLAVKKGFLETAAGQRFFNTSEFTFESLLHDPENIKDNFESYLNHFSPNVADIIHHMKFYNEITNLADNNRLYLIIKEFCSPKAYLGADEVSSVEMGYIFEELVRKFSEQYDDQAGAHFTARDIIDLMAEILAINLSEGDEITANVYDMAMGTSQMLGCLTDKFRELDPEAEVTTYGQELNPYTYAIAKADTLIKGGRADNMKLGDTLGNDRFAGYTFDYIISNPPFGIEWKTSKDAVEREQGLGAAGRFPTSKLPAIGDGQMLFMLNGVAKLRPSGRMAIIQNGSPLFKGGAGSGESEIRGYLLENDYVEAIIQLPANLFYNTPLTTYIWVITKDKAANRAGKVQLIDAGKAFEKRRKPIGNKSVDITARCRALIMEAYTDFANRQYSITDTDIRVESRVKDYDDFKYTQLTIQRPLRLRYDALAIPADAVLKDSERRYLEEVINAWEEMLGGHAVDDFALFTMLKQAGIKTTAANVKLIRRYLATKDPSAQPARSKPTDLNSRPEWDPDLSDTEIVPWKQPIREYLEANVLPYAPDAVVDEEKTAIGYEIPMTREFYRYEPLRPSAEIFAQLKDLEAREAELMTKILGK